MRHLNISAKQILHIATPAPFFHVHETDAETVKTQDELIKPN